MDINIKTGRNFTTAFNHIVDKYGEEFEILNGFHSSQMNFSDFIEGFIDKNVSDVTIDANANVKHKDIASLRSEKGKSHDKLFAFNKIFYELNKKYGLADAREWLELEYSGAYYLHDAPSSTYIPYCYAYDLTRLAKEGLFFLNSYNAEPPKHLTTFLDDVIEYVSYMSNRSSGAVGLPNIIIWSYYFWKKDCETGYYIKSPDYYLKQCFQKLIYRLNQPFLRVDQSSFTNISIFDRNYLSELFAAAQQMDSAVGRIGCAEQLLRDPNLLTEGWRNTLLYKRLECKRASIERLLEITKGSWEHALYISLARNFGFHTNSLPFEQLAINTPLSILQKHRNSLFQLTAILMGQAGLLEVKDERLRDEGLAKEYAFMQAKFGLTPMNASIWKHSKLRPQNSPELRIRQFAQLLYQSDSLLSKILDTDDLKELEALFAVDKMGKSSIDILLINTVIPYKYAYAKHRNKSLNAQALMAQIPAENNTIIRQWRILGQQIKNAADTQALLHLYQNYCQHHECINCEVGYQIFQDRQFKLF